jgi:hypothetical protein
VSDDETHQSQEHSRRRSGAPADGAARCAAQVRIDCRWRSRQRIGRGEANGGGDASQRQRVRRMIITAAQRMTITRELGPGVMRAADALRVQLNEHGKADAALWRAFLQALMDGAGDAMSSPLGMAIQLAIVGKIQGDRNANDDASERRSKAQWRLSSTRTAALKNRCMRAFALSPMTLTS